jgi:hypothetical protein
MKINQWTLGLAAVGVVSLASAVNAEEANRVMNALQTQLSSTTISGYVDTSVEWTLDRTGYTPQDFDSWGMVPFRGDSKQNGFNLNVVKLSIEKPMDESEWASGYKVDLLFGPDAVAYNPSANINDFDNSDGGSQDGDFADFGIKQAYVALRTPVGNGIDWKIGVFDTIIGYETFEAGNNPNFTRSWGYAIEPTQHTGILGTYRISDNVAVAFGVANTLSSGINSRNDELGTDSFWRKTYMGSVAVTAPNDLGFLSGSTFYAGIVGGFSGGPVDQINYYAGATLNTPVAGLKAGIAFDYVDNKGGSDGTGFDEYEDDAWVVGLYASYQATEKLSLHGRAEYGDNKYESAYYDDEGNEYMTSLTGTIQYDLWKNVISRIEARWDQMQTKGTSEGFDYDYVDATSFGLYANFIYKF